MNFTIYTVNGDISLLTGVLNGVAMICGQTLFIWGFAVLVSVWRQTASVATTALHISAGTNGVLSKSAMHSLMPLILAMLLTNPGFQSTVTVESTINGVVSSVSNIPMVISVIPAAASEMSQDVGALVETAFQGVGTDYPSISASGNGFINPLKVLLTSRTAMLRLGSIDSEVRSVVSNCITQDSGISSADVIALVTNAGNSGATAAQSIAINGANPTALGALLYQASQNTMGFVPDINGAGATVLSCSDAAVVVANNVTNALNSAEFARVVQGAVNGMDQPVPGATITFSSLNTAYSATRTATTTMSALAGGANQATAEMINLLTSEMVANNLGCLKAEAANKVVCNAASTQANEVERHNILAASSEVPMLKYAGSFANYLTALIIGLGPVIVMGMMFVGADAGKTVKTTLHVMAWPLLTMNVGAELINGMIYMSTSHFLSAIAQSGYITQANAIEAYKQFSLQIGTASHLMASLPVLMSTIFALGAASSLASVSNSNKPETKQTTDTVAPPLVASTPVMSQSSMYSSQQGQGGANVKAAGAVNAASFKMDLGTQAEKFADRSEQVETKARHLSEGTADIEDWKKGKSSGVYQRYGFNEAEGDAFRSAFLRNRGIDHSESASGAVLDNKTNSNNAETHVNGGVGVGWKTGVSASIGGGGSTSTGAGNSLSASKTTTVADKQHDSDALSKTLEEFKSKQKSTDHGGDKNKTFDKALQTQKDFRDTLTKDQSLQHATSQLVEEGNSLTAATANIGAPEIGQSWASNPEYRRFAHQAGRKLEDSEAAKPYIERAKMAMTEGQSDQLAGDEGARKALINHSAAQHMATDKALDPSTRAAAMSYLANEAKAITGSSVDPVKVGKLNFDIADPVNRTSINSEKLRQEVGKGVGDKASIPKAVQRQGYKGEPGTQQKPAGNPHAPTPNEAALLKASVSGRVESGDIKSRVQHAKTVAENAGLGDTGPGVVIRTAKNVADNVIDIGRERGAASNTSTGAFSPNPQDKH